MLPLDTAPRVCMCRYESPYSRALHQRLAAKAERLVSVDRSFQGPVMVT